MPIFKIQHVTKYEYDRLVQESVNEIKIFPYLSSEQEVLQHELSITGNPEVQSYADYWGNKTGVFNLLPPHKELIIDSRVVVRTTTSPGLRVDFSGDFNRLEQEVSGHLKMLELAKADIQLQTDINEIGNTVVSSDNSIAATIQNCSEYIFKNFNYIKGITTIETTVEEILEQRAGVCQDFAHVMLQILRTLKIPSRYVSGYICPNQNGLRGEGATHAWVEAWIPEYGWAGIDPTNNVWVSNTHVRLAVGRHFTDCSPVKGTFKGSAKQNLSVYVSVGYEDGQIFEELNNVNLNKQNTMAELSLKDFGSQQ